MRTPANRMPCVNRSIRSGIAADRCWTVYNTLYSSVDRRPGRPALAQFDIPPDTFVVATVGTFRRVKGADLLLKAATECANLSDIYWLLIGKTIDPEIHRLAADPRIRDRVRLVGHRPDAAELVSGADLFVMPSRAEALCQALLEAMHQGVCPVVSDAGGMKEVVRHGVDGLVVAQECVHQLANAVRRLQTDTMSQSTICECFSATSSLSVHGRANGLQTAHRLPRNTRSPESYS